MSTENKADCRRRCLVVATAAAGGAGLLVGAMPFLSALSPTAREKAAGAPVEVDIAGILPGQLMTAEWRGRPVWIFNRTPEMLETLARLTNRVLDPDSTQKQQPDSCANGTRSIRPNLLVVMGVCTHFGCAPAARFKKGVEEGMPSEWPGGFLCQCHGASFDFAGRVFRNTVASRNLEVPPHRYLSETRILIGENGESA